MNERGSLLFEAVIAAAIMSVLAASILPRIFDGGTGLMTLEGEAARLSTELQYFRTLVMSVQRSHSDFSAAPSEVTPQFMLEGDAYYIRSGTRLILRHTLPRGVTLKSGSRSAVFKANGGGTPLTIALHAGQEVRYVIIDLAGRVRISHTPPK